MTALNLDWLSFSSYELIDNLGGSLNPLGLQSTQNSIANYLLPQFTTLTRDPRSHNVLCGLLLGLKELKGIVTTLEIRRAENFWGFLQTALGIQENLIRSPLNVEKYSALLKGNNFKISSRLSIKNQLSERLAYGLYGFYVQPSIKWGLVTDDGKGLTSLGEQLGKEFNEMTGFGKLLRDWLRDELKSLDFQNPKLLEIARKTKIGSMGNESEVWKLVIQDFKKKNVRYKDFWENLPTNNNHDYVKLRKLYSKNTEITNCLKLQEAFEFASAYTNFLFDVLYLIAQKKEVKVEFSSIYKQVEKELVQSFNEYKDAQVLLIPVAKFLLNPDLRSPEAFQNWIVNHHKQVQKSKGKSPYFDERLNVFQFDQKNMNSAYEVLKDITHDSIIKNYSLDWRFESASRYKGEVYEK